VLAEAATSGGQAPAPAAAAAAATAAASAAAASAAAASAAAASAAAASGELHAGLMRAAALLVEDVECRQADIGDFFFTERDRRCGVARGRHIRCRPDGRRGSSARERQGKPSRSQHRYGFRPTRSLRWHT
jgi:hypothetical protein